VPIIGPLIGGAIGGYLYDLVIGRFLPLEGEPEVGRETEVPTEGRAEPAIERPPST
jgi:glycerol uptake facilitator protein